VERHNREVYPVMHAASQVLPRSVMYVGKLGRTSNHAVHALKVVIAIQGKFRIRMEKGEWQMTTSAVIRPGQSHQLAAPHIKSVVAYMLPYELPDSGVARSVTFTTQLAVPALEALRSRLQHEVLASSRSIDAAAWLPQLFQAAQAGHDSPTTDIDPRVVRAIERHDVDMLTLGEAARAAGLSASRFSHLFRQQMGSTFPHFGLLMKMRRAITTLAAGASLTEAAHASGFADLAHFSRTFRQMFGVAPSEVSLAGLPLVSSRLPRRRATRGVPSAAESGW
jgi:AraC family transcriptional regulator